MNTEGLKILIVDDEVDLCQVLAWDFEDLGFKVSIANGGHEAIEKLKEEDIDIVLTDIKMPHGDGLEVLDSIKSESIKLKAVFLMTGYSDYPEDKLIEKGMTKLFKKPIDSETIINEIKKL